MTILNLSTGMEHSDWSIYKGKKVIFYFFVSPTSKNIKDIQISF